MNALHSDSDATTLVIRSPDTETVVRLCNRWQFDADSVHYAVEASAPGMTARVDEALAAIWEPHPNLPTFLDELARDFHGWLGERSWRSLENDLGVSAVFRSGGHVGLTWTPAPVACAIRRLERVRDDLVGGWRADDELGRRRPSVPVPGAGRQRLRSS